MSTLDFQFDDLPADEEPQDVSPIAGPAGGSNSSISSLAQSDRTPIAKGKRRRLSVHYADEEGEDDLHAHDMEASRSDQSHGMSSPMARLWTHANDRTPHRTHSEGDHSSTSNGTSNGSPSSQQVARNGIEISSPSGTRRMSMDGADDDHGLSTPTDLNKSSHLSPMSISPRRGRSSNTNLSSSPARSTALAAASPAHPKMLLGSPMGSPTGHAFDVVHASRAAVPPHLAGSPARRASSPSRLGPPNGLLSPRFGPAHASPVLSPLHSSSMPNFGSARLSPCAIDILAVDDPNEHWPDEHRIGPAHSSPSHAPASPGSLNLPGPSSLVPPLTLTPPLSPHEEPEKLLQDSPAQPGKLSPTLEGDATVALTARGRTLSPTGEKRRHRRTPSSSSPAGSPVESFLDTFTPTEDSSHAAALLSSSPIHSEPPLNEQRATSPVHSEPRAIVSHPGLEMPPPSGWDLSEDTDDSPTSSPIQTSAVLQAQPDPHQQIDSIDPSELTEPSFSFQALAETSEPTMSDLSDTGLDLEDESLSILERVFLYAKSENACHRVTVAQALAEWLEEVDICESVEFILPLLNGLAQDEEDVRIGLARTLDKILLYYFTRCPLAELDMPESAPASTPAAGTSKPIEGGRPPSLLDVAHMRDAVHSSDQVSIGTTSSSSTLVGSCGNSTADDTPKTEHQLEDITPRKIVARLPTVSVGAFTQLLLGLLTDELNEISSSAQSALMQERSHAHPPYSVSSEAQELIKTTIALDVVLTLLQADHENAASSQMQGVELSSPPAHDAIHLDDRAQSPSAASPATSEPELNLADPAELYYRQDPHTVKNEDGHTFEVVQAEIMGLHLLHSVADIEIFEGAFLATNFMRDVFMLAQRQHPSTRLLAISTIGALARTIPREQVTDAVLPLHHKLGFDNDPQTRRAACLILPEICKRLDLHGRSAEVQRACDSCITDASADVRIGLLEVAGQLIHLFAEASDRVPQQLLQFYLAEDDRPPRQEADMDTSEDTPFAPLVPSFGEDETASSSNGGDQSPWAAEHALINAFKSSRRSYERSIICAFNFPAVIQTLGRDRWPEVREFYLELARESQMGVRRSLAASIFEVARIVGPVITNSDLVEPFSAFVTVSDDAQACVLEHFGDFVSNLTPETASSQIAMLITVLKGDSTPAWRVRLAIASQLSAIGNAYGRGGADDPWWHLISTCLVDEVSDVRVETANAVALMLLHATDQNLASRLIRSLHLELVSDASYRRRMVSLLLPRACLHHLMPIADFMRYFCSTLLQLAQDRIVDVRLATARIALTLCEEVNRNSTESDHDAISELLDCLRDDTSATIRELFDGVRLWTPPGSGPSTAFDSRAATTSSFDDDDDELLNLPDDLTDSAIRELDANDDALAEDAQIETKFTDSDDESDTSSVLTIALDKTHHAADDLPDDVNSKRWIPPRQTEIDGFVHLDSASL
ncbi:hypothetical protein E5Q_02344 [Mixia osmundae IAM 14324]|uniref:TOG domain-containing protein n=1 Tax=Mixia osmundae (strain CBS 9802 / IAM 14324 / JCM 22182 / KY 12970) TaxID=764103 RepID=G7DYM7_MIXOS|nr:hypothetical protein E5Q_02344 [Mixia osmundae IAM 14324]